MGPRLIGNQTLLNLPIIVSWDVAIYTFYTLLLHQVEMLQFKAIYATFADFIIYNIIITYSVRCHLGFDRECENSFYDSSDLGWRILNLTCFSLGKNRLFHDSESISKKKLVYGSLY